MSFSLYIRASLTIVYRELRMQKKKGQNLILGLPLQRIKQYEQKSYFLVPLPVFFFLVVLQAMVKTSFLLLRKYNEY